MAYQIWSLLLSVAWLFSMVLGSTRHPNILMIIADDLRPDLGCYGHQIARTPNIDMLAKRSTVFYNTHSQYALCGPSRTSILTGRRPDTLTVYDQFKPYWRTLPNQNYTSLPQYFKEKGYQTVSMGKVFHPSRLANKSDDYPYSWSELPYHPPSQKYKNSPVCVDGDGSLHSNLLCPVNVSSQPGHTLPDIETTQESIRVLDRLSKQVTPFMLAVGLHKPHIPLKFPSKYLDMYPLSEISPAADHHRPKNVSSLAWNPFLDIKRRDDMAGLNIHFPYGGVPRHYQKRIIQGYLASISYVDGLVGDILIQVEKKSLWNNTIIVFMSDHGWSLGEHGEWSKYSNYDVSTRVPLIIYTPEHMRNIYRSQVYDMTELVDLFPSLVELTGHRPLEKCQNKTTVLCAEGKSLVPAMRGKRFHDSPSMNVSMTQYPRPSIKPQNNSDQPKTEDIRFMGYAIKTTQYRYVTWVSWDSTNLTPNMSDMIAEELYDIYTDPGEDNNLIGRLPLVQDKLHKQLVKFIHRYD